MVLPIDILTDTLTESEIAKIISEKIQRDYEDRFLQDIEERRDRYKINDDSGMKVAVTNFKTNKAQ
jgi:hypothetical protein